MDKNVGTLAILRGHNVSRLVHHLEFVYVLAGVRPVQAADGELEQTLSGVFASMCPYNN